MPSPTTSQLPKPKNWDEFEDIVADLFRDLWKDNYITRNGRSGQKQNGVDIYGQPYGLAKLYAGVQCKLSDKLTLSTIENEVEEAKGFRPPLAEYLIATTMSRDAQLQEQVRMQGWPFRVEILFWEDLSLLLSGSPTLLTKHFHGWIKNNTSHEQIQEMIMRSVPSDFRHNPSTGEYFLGSDVDLRIVVDQSDSAARDRKFEEPWVEKFPDPTAYRQEVYIYYRNTRIQHMLFVSVDGGRYLLPAPKSPTDLTITQFQDLIGRIINFNPDGNGYDYDEGLHSVDFKVLNV